ADDHYNRGNALAKAGDLSAAVEAYTQSLEINPSDEDAAFNKALVEQLLEQQSQEDQSSQSDEGEEGNDQDQTDESQSGQNQNGEDEETSKDESQSQANADEETQDDAAQEQQQSAEETTEDENESEETNEIDPSEALSQEESQALDQWLKRVPDDPGGLLRRKFEQQFEERVRQGDITREDFERNW
ncbi:MAG: tetratricopeptide repeat protein, partial [Proteobacteria bacterium]|nr:tetratricopeptide repeat protein [Pseudomonadota bacterium]